MKARVLATSGLVAASLLVAAGTATAASAAPSTVRTGPVAADYPAPQDAEAQLFGWLNTERTSRGLTALIRTTTLDTYARQWSDFMAAGSCVTPQNASRLCHRPNLVEVANAAYPGAWMRVGENVGLVPMYGTLESLHAAFMASPGHRANILEPSYNALGLGVTIGADGTLFATYEFVSSIEDPANPNILPTPPPGLDEAGQLLFYINDARQHAGLAPLTMHPVLLREAQSWAHALATGTACKGTTALCHRSDMSTVTKAVVGSTGSRWWSENVGYRYGTDLVSQFKGFMRSAPHKANIMRANINLVGIGFETDPLGRAFTVMEFVSAKQPLATTPPNGEDCGWVTSTVSKGAKGAFVRSLQCALARAGAWNGPIDGLYTQALKDAVKAYQSQHGVKRPTGSADLKTRRWLGVSK
jgi:uncharacterized protein YkwD